PRDDPAGRTAQHRAGQAPGRRAHPSAGRPLRFAPGGRRRDARQQAAAHQRRGGRQMNVRLTAIALCVVMAGCAQLPDLELAKRARTGGDLQTAENNFRSLAELGYEDAELGLADVLVQRPEPERQAEGEAIYRRAAAHSLQARIKLGKWLAVKENASDAE